MVRGFKVSRDPQFVEKPEDSMAPGMTALPRSTLPTIRLIDDSVSLA